MVAPSMKALLQLNCLVLQSLNQRHVIPQVLAHQLALSRNGSHGRFRLASDGYSGGGAFHYNWGDNLLVIVEDTKAIKSNNRFKLVYFGLANGTTGKFKANWVLHNLDLSKCEVSNASSDLVIYELGADRHPSLEWDTKRKRYTCLR